MCPGLSSMMTNHVPARTSLPVSVVCRGVPFFSKTVHHGACQRDDDDDSLTRVRSWWHDRGGVMEQLTQNFGVRQIFVVVRGVLTALTHERSQTTSRARTPFSIHTIIQYIALSWILDRGALIMTPIMWDKRMAFHPAIRYYK